MDPKNFIETALDNIRRDGFTVIKDALAPEVRSAIRLGLDPWLQGTRMGRNDFEGIRSERVYALLAKVPEIAAMVEHRETLAIVDALLPKNHLLSAALAINLHPGETPQRFHIDDGGNALPIPQPRAMLGVSTMWALDDFTSENGATEVIPGSHHWSEDRKPQERGSTAINMPAGAVLIFAGNLFHRGGANRSAQHRLGITIQYCDPNMRQLENMSLAVPLATAALFSPRIQALLGYSVIDPGFKGSVNGRHPKALFDANYKGRKYRDELPAS